MKLKSSTIEKPWNEKLRDKGEGERAKEKGFYLVRNILDSIRLDHCIKMEEGWEIGKRGKKKKRKSVRWELPKRRLWVVVCLCSSVFTLEVWEWGAMGFCFSYYCFLAQGACKIHKYSKYSLTQQRFFFHEQIIIFVSMSEYFKYLLISLVWFRIELYYILLPRNYIGYLIYSFVRNKIIDIILLDKKILT